MQKLSGNVSVSKKMELIFAELFPIKNYNQDTNYYLFPCVLILSNFILEVQSIM